VILKKAEGSDWRERRLTKRCNGPASLAADRQVR
jgi:hypothetical protein